MSFGSFSPAVLIAGALALAVILYLLQRLRTQRRIVYLPTVSLWQQAAHALPARVLGRRFRYWLAYLLALAIGLLLWLAAAHPMPDPLRRGGMQVFYLDVSATMAAGDEAVRARRALLADVRSVPAARRLVVAGDGEAGGTTLLAPGESASLLAQRLSRVRVSTLPSAFATWLAQAAPPSMRDAPTTVNYYGNWPAVRAAAAHRPDTVVLRPGYLTAPVVGNRGIVALGVRPAASGRWGVVDVLVGLAAAPPAPLLPFAATTWTLDDRPFMPERVERAGSDAFVLRDVAASGGLLAVRLGQADGFPADDRASVRLPDGRPLRVAVSANVPAAIANVVRADDAFATAAAADAQVVVRRMDETLRPDLPALVLSRDGPAFVVAGPGERGRDDVADRLDRLGLSQLDAAALADSLRRPIGADLRDSARRSVTAWGVLFAPGTPFARSPTMPLFVSRSLRWLARGDAPSPDDASDEAAPLNRGITLAAGDASARPTAAERLGRVPSDLPFFVLLIAAGLLLAVEWWLFQRGRMP